MIHRSLRAALVLLIAGVTLAGCSSKDDKPTSTATPVPATATATATATVVAAAATVAPTTITTEGQIISDGLCQANLPDDWVDNSAGSGSAPSGAKYALFGNRVRSDEAWKEAVDLVKTQAATKSGAKTTEGDTFVRVDYANNSGFEYRGRFDTLYCDFSVTSTSAVPDDERAVWDSIISSLGPVATSTLTSAATPS